MSHCHIKRKNYCRMFYQNQVRGHMDPDAFRHRLVDIAIGRDAEIKEYCRIRTVDHPQCSAPKQASTNIVLLQHGLYEGRPASKILLIPRTGIAFSTHITVHPKHIQVFLESSGPAVCPENTCSCPHIHLLTLLMFL